MREEARQQAARESSVPRRNVAGIGAAGAGGRPCATGRGPRDGRCAARDPARRAWRARRAGPPGRRARAPAAGTGGSRGRRPALAAGRRPGSGRESGPRGRPARRATCDGPPSCTNASCSWDSAWRIGPTCVGRRSARPPAAAPGPTRSRAAPARDRARPRCRRQPGPPHPEVDQRHHVLEQDLLDADPLDLLLVGGPELFLGGRCSSGRSDLACSQRHLRRASSTPEYVARVSACTAAYTSRSVRPARSRRALALGAVGARQRDLDPELGADRLGPAQQPIDRLGRRVWLARSRSSNSPSRP